MAEIALWNRANQASEDAQTANKRLDALAPLVHEQAEKIEKLQGEIKAMKARMGKKQD